MADISLHGITKKYGSNTALRNLDLDIKDGEFFVLLGQTGAGKTTTLRVIAGLEVPDSGTVMINGQDATKWNAAERDVALVLQQYSLYPRMTVRGNLEFPLKSRTQNHQSANQPGQHAADTTGAQLFTQEYGGTYRNEYWCYITNGRDFSDRDARHGKKPQRHTKCVNKAAKGEGAHQFFIGWRFAHPPKNGRDEKHSKTIANES